MRGKTIAGFILITACFLPGFLAGADGKETKVIEANYMDASELGKALVSVKSAEGDVTVLNGTSQIVVSDRPDKVLQMESIAKQLDVRKEQVEVRAVIAEVSEELLKEEGFSFPHGIIPGDKFKGMLGLIDRDELSSVSSETSLRVASGETATLKVTDNMIMGGVFLKDSKRDVYVEPYEIKAGIILEVTPFVNKDGLITLKIRPEMSEFREGAVKYERSASSTLRVLDGDAVLLGGTDTYESGEAESFVPLFGIRPQETRGERNTRIFFFLTAEVVD